MCKSGLTKCSKDKVDCVSSARYCCQKYFTETKLSNEMKVQWYACKPILKIFICDVNHILCLSDLEDRESKRNQ